jgi:hypothetical protein
MASNNYIKLPNQGNISSNLRLLYEMQVASDYADSQGYYTKRDIAEIAANALLITTSSQIGNDVIATIDNTDINEGDNSPLQNAKMRMQILRILGLVSADYFSEVYAITELGKLYASDRISSIMKKHLLRELFLGIEASSESYDFTCEEGFHCFLGLEICYALSQLGYRIGVDEMPVITTYDYREIDDFVRDAKMYRSQNLKFPNTHVHFPKTAKGKPLKQASNITRTINQILRYCGIIKPKALTIGKKRYYECTDFGVEYVKNIGNNWNRKKISLITPYIFRKNGVLEQRTLCQQGLSNIFIRAGIDRSQKDTGIYFSPYQSLSETSASWFLNRNIRNHPDSAKERVSMINSSVSARDLRIKTTLKEASNDRIKELAQEEALVVEMQKCNTLGKCQEFVNSEFAKHANDDKFVFYPYIHSLLKILGLECHGEIGRYDAYTKYKGHIIPVEIKSATEVFSYNQKGIRQAIENKICSYNSDIDNDLEYASLVIGYTHPELDGDIKLLIDRAKEQYNIKIIACDLKGVLSLCVKMVSQNMQIDLDELLTNYGLLIV